MKLKIFAASLCCMAVASPALAAGICWIDTVEKTPTGVAVHFTDRRMISLDSASGGSQAVDVDPKAAAGANTSKSLEAKLGDRFSSHNTPEDGCSMEVVSQDGKIGVMAHATNCMMARMTGKCDQVSNFVEAK
jgi:hypothetical protein